MLSVVRLQRHSKDTFANISVQKQKLSVVKVYIHRSKLSVPGGIMLATKKYIFFLEKKKKTTVYTQYFHLQNISITLSIALKEGFFFSRVFSFQQRKLVELQQTVKYELDEIMIF